MARDLSKATTFKDKVRPASAVSRWSMDDSDLDSGTIRDSWGGNDGSLKNGVSTGVSGVGGGEAFSFDGSDDYVNIGLPASLEFAETDAFTISVWVKFDALGANEKIFATRDDNSNYIFLRKTTSDDIELGINTSGTENRASASINQDGAWYHIVGVNKGDGSSDCIQVWLNAIKKAKATNTTSSSTIDSGWNIGRKAQNGGEHYLAGELDELRIYSEALSQQQIWKLYNIGRNANWGFSRS